MCEKLELPRNQERNHRVEDTDVRARMQTTATSMTSCPLDLFDVADYCAITGHIRTTRPL
jgi:hypothetical protein